MPSIHPFIIPLEQHRSTYEGLGYILIPQDSSNYLFGQLPHVRSIASMSLTVLIVFSGLRPNLIDLDYRHCRLGKAHTCLFHALWSSIAGDRDLY